MSLKEFFGFGGYQRAAEGFLSWQHLVFVTVLNGLMVAAAVALGRRDRTRNMAQRRRVLGAAALLADGIEIFKVVMICIRCGDWTHCLSELPLFLCSIQLITMPLAAFAGGRLREAALDFVCIFGLVGAVLGTYGAGNNYAAFPVISLENVASGLTHCLSGFASLYVILAGMAAMERRNMPIAYGMIAGFCALAFAANCLLDTNYMFLMRGDGTPYDILFRLFNGNPVLYPLAVFALFVICIAAYYLVFGLVRSRRKAVQA